MYVKKRGLGAMGVWSVWAGGLAVVVATACGSDDSTRTPRTDPDAGGAGAGSEAVGGTPSGGGGPVGGMGGSSEVGAAGGPEPAAGGTAGTGDGGDIAGAPGSAGAAGATGEDCESFELGALEGLWTSSCNGYTCNMYIADSGDLSDGCSNGQFESGKVELDGTIATLGEGGPYAAYSTKGTLTRDDCETLTRDYVGQIPPTTGPEVHYSCQMTRLPDCAPSLLEALAGAWDGDCGGNETCVTTFTIEGDMSSTCSNGQSSTGSIEETGAFSDAGGGGNFPDYSTTGVIALNADCESFLMPYIYQIPPNQGTHHSAQCSYTRHQDE